MWTPEKTVTKYIFILLTICLAIALVSWVSPEWIYVMGLLCLGAFHFITMRDSEEVGAEDVTTYVYIAVVFFYEVLAAIFGYVHVLLFVFAYELWYFFLQKYVFIRKWTVGKTGKASLLASVFTMAIYLAWIRIFV